MKSNQLRQAFIVSTTLLFTQGCATTSTTSNQEKSDTTTSIDSNYCIAGAAGAWLLTGDPLVTTLAIGGVVWCLNQEKADEE